MSGEGLADATRRLVYLLAALYVVAALAGIAFGAVETVGDGALWVGFLCGGAAIMTLAQKFAPPGWTFAALVSVGAILGGLPLFFTIVVPIVAAIVVTCSIALARRRPATA